ncbi:uncharacterized protein CEXT_527641 [Caerostris extrusa]|uniref:Uncharacterized protein n=1 Tax=Caerostris extrusa TaxID=172846 RepID=A0AAV4NKA8_CAEEX|nr:uncharacterized protein CEXT_527641 [Caerostris extrusa]
MPEVQILRIVLAGCPEDFPHHQFPPDRHEQELAQATHQDRRLRHVSRREAQNFLCSQPKYKCTFDDPAEFCDKYPAKCPGLDPYILTVDKWTLLMNFHHFFQLITLDQIIDKKYDWRSSLAEAHNDTVIKLCIDKLEEKSRMCKKPYRRVPVIDAKENPMCVTPLILCPGASPGHPGRGVRGLHGSRAAPDDDPRPPDACQPLLPGILPGGRGPLQGVRLHDSQGAAATSVRHKVPRLLERMAGKQRHRATEPFDVRRTLQVEKTSRNEQVYR